MPEDISKQLVTYEDLEALKKELVDFNLGFIGCIWNDLLHYNIGDIVYYNKKLFVCQGAAPVGIPPVEGVYWKQVKPTNYEYPCIEDLDTLVTTADEYAIAVSEGD